MAKCGRGRPDGLGITPIWLNFANVDPGFKQSPKLVELVKSVKIIVIRFQKHEIQRNVGGKNHRN